MTPVFSINGHPIPWSFWGLIVYKYCNKDRELAARVVYRAMIARDENGKPFENPAGWIIQGLKKGGYCWNACRDETEAPGKVRAWIDEVVLKIGQGKSGPQKINKLLIDTLTGMLEKARGRHDGLS